MGMLLSIPHYFNETWQVRRDIVQVFLLKYDDIPPFGTVNYFRDK